MFISPVALKLLGESESNPKNLDELVSEYNRLIEAPVYSDKCVMVYKKETIDRLRIVFSRIIELCIKKPMKFEG